MLEEWRDVKGYEGLYQVSNTGVVKSVDRISPQGHHLKERIRKICTDKDGYRVVNLCKCGKVSMLKVHRLVAEAFISNPEDKPQVNHIDGNKANNAVDNLEWSTSSENVIHAYNTGLHGVTHNRFFGESNPHCKISDEDIYQLIDDFVSGMCRQDIVSKYGIGKTQMYRIVNGKQRAKGSEVVYA